MLDEVGHSDDESALSLLDESELQSALGAVVTCAGELEYAMHGLT